MSFTALNAFAQDQLPPLPIVKAVPAIPQGLDLQMKYEGESSAYVAAERASTLVQFDSAKLERGGCGQTPNVQTDIRPNLAESWTVDRDGKFVEFKLRAGVKSAAGNEMTAEDVKWSIDRGLALASIARFLINDASRFRKENPVEIVDPLTVRIHFDQPSIFQLVVFTWSQLQILDKKAVEPHITADDPWGSKWVNLNAVDFGPWTITEQNFAAGNRVVFEPNPNYFAPETRGNANRLISLGIPESATRSQLLRSGEIDYAAGLSLQDIRSLSSDQAIRTDTCVGAVRDTLLLNFTDERFGNPLVREAISLAIDRQAIVDAVFSGFGRPALTGIHQDFGTEGMDLYIRHDLEKAKQLMAEAGYADGFTAKFTVSQSRPGAHAIDEAIFIANQLKQIKIMLDIEIIASGTAFSERFFKGDYQAMLYSESPAFADPFYSLNLMNHGNSFQNSFKYAEPRYDALVTEGLQLPGDDADRRRAILVELSKVMAERNPQVYLVDTVITQAWSAKVSNFENQGTIAGNISAYKLKKQP
jgi:peptide/nickel transport system substrate-binding protein